MWVFLHQDVNCFKFLFCTSVTLSNGSVPQPLLSVSIQRAAQTFSVINFANILAVSSSASVAIDLTGVGLCILHPRAPSVFHFPIVVNFGPRMGFMEKQGRHDHRCFHCHTFKS